MNNSKRLSKVFREMYNTARVLSSNTESWASCFTRLLSNNEELTEQDKKIIQEWSIDFFEVRKERDKIGKQIQCLECNSIKYSDMHCENCMKESLKRQFSSWTSENKLIDDFIQQCQQDRSISGSIIEWIPFNQFKSVKYLSDGGFSKVYTAVWTKGLIKKWDNKKNKFIRFGPTNVVLKAFNNSEQLGEKFFKE
ncbi:3930_t:CDS:1, partial [Scutellospora calospora]